MNHHGVRRWIKNMESIAKDNIYRKDFYILNLEEAISTQIAIMIVHGPPNSPY